MFFAKPSPRSRPQSPIVPPWLVMSKLSLLLDVSLIVSKAEVDEEEISVVELSALKILSSEVTSKIFNSKEYALLHDNS